jgi:rfaE bifunctional protein nucleotidyltransferase chain/domain
MIDQKIFREMNPVAVSRWLGELGRKVILTNGCFDLLHAGHVRYLEAAKQYGDILVVAVNSDESVRQLKGEGRPLRPLEDRLVTLAAMEAVDLAFPFDDLRIDKLLREIKPAVWIKGGDYTVETLDKGEVEAAKEVGCEIIILPLVQSLSTTEILERMNAPL